MNVNLVAEKQTKLIDSMLSPQFGYFNNEHFSKITRADPRVKVGWIQISDNSSNFEAGQKWELLGHTKTWRLLRGGLSVYCE